MKVQRLSLYRFNSRIHVSDKLTCSRSGGVNTNANNRSL